VLRSADVATFLAANGVSAPIHVQGDMPELPDQVVLIDFAGGLSSTYEMLFDRPALRLTVRGSQSDPASAEALAEAVDNAFLNVGGLINIGGKHVTNIQRLSGPPAFIGLDSQSARRPIFQATYIPEIAR
jgi:hypothetical protein